MDKKIEKAADEYRGVTVDEADGCKVDPRAVKEDVKELNDNPHSDGI